MCSYSALSSTIADHIAMTMEQTKSDGPHSEKKRVNQLEFCSYSRRPTRTNSGRAMRVHTEIESGDATRAQTRVGRRELE